MNPPSGDPRTDRAPSPRSPIRIGPAEPPVLVALVATEEEFDWTAEFDRRATSVRSAARLPRAQAVFDEFGIRPTYLCDFAIASQPEGYEPINEVLAGGRAELGAHLHPWINPPFDEPLTRQNSFPGNLDAALERAKLASLLDELQRHTRARPRVYQAGRYGFGAHTARTLRELAIEVDCSESPAFDFSREGGPDYSRADIAPHWDAQERELLRLPVTGGFLGFLGSSGREWHALATHRRVGWTRIGALFARLRAVERMRLSPEGHSFDDLRRLTLGLAARGAAVFTFTFHSPTLLPGCTSYVSSESELQRFFDTCRRYFAFFRGELGGRALTPLELRSAFMDSDARAIR